MFSDNLTLLFALFLALIVYTVASFGLSWIVGHSRASRPIRLALYDSGGLLANLVVEMLECPGCFGAWLGFFVALSVHLIFRDVTAAIFIVFPTYTAGSNYLLGRATGLISPPDVDY